MNNEQDKNQGTSRDPSGPLGSHPVSTGLGAVGGMAAGAAVGTVAGPIGTIAGATAGAILGGVSIRRSKTITGRRLFPTSPTTSRE